jgi:hypothetical protein
MIINRLSIKNKNIKKKNIRQNCFLNKNNYRFAITVIKKFREKFYCTIFYSKKDFLLIYV